MIEVLNAIAYRGTPVVEDNEEREWRLEQGAAWDVDSENVIKFVKESNKKIASSGKEYTTFKRNPSNRDFPTLLKRYVNNEISFEFFHQNYAAHKLKSNLKSSRLEEGAVIVFVHFNILREIEEIEEQETDLPESPDPEVIGNNFLVLMVRNTGALQFTDDLQIAETDVIDLKQFVQGCQVDLERFLSQGDLDEGEVDNFLFFVRGGADIREYFKEAIFAEKGITNKASSENLERAITDFWVEHKSILDRTVRDDIQHSVYQFSGEHKGSTVTLERVAAVIDRCIPDEYVDLRGQFLEFANGGAYEINDEFEINFNIIKGLVYVDLDVGFATLRLERQSLGSSDDDERSVRFNSDTNELTFTTTITDHDQITKIQHIIDNE